MPDSIQYLCIGHLAKDLTPEGHRLGGAVAYASLTARALGYRPGLVTAWGDDLDVSLLADIPCMRSSSPVSTTYENIYTGGERAQYLHASAALLSLAAIPQAWRRASIIHVAPIIREVEPEIITTLAADHSFVCLTPQGWLRAWDKQGRVRNGGWRSALEFLPLVSATVVSLEDLNGDWDIAERWATVAPVLALTEGPRGCTIFVKGEIFRHFPAPAVREVDPTGAGDVFAAAFFIHLHATRDPWAAAQFANRVAALSVTRPGLAGIPTPDEINKIRET